MNPVVAIFQGMHCLQFKDFIKYFQGADLFSSIFKGLEFLRLQVFSKISHARYEPWQI